MFKKRVAIIPYLMGSRTAKALKNALQQKLDIPVRLFRKNSLHYQPRWTDYVINWGCSTEWPWINNTSKNGNQICVNKLSFFEQVTAFNQVNTTKTVNIPEWTTEPVVAAAWNKPFFARTILNGHSGAGIIEYDANPHTIKLAPLYVQYKKKRHEYRVHFFKDGHNYTIIDISQKKKRKGFENVNTKVRNHKNGWVYAREDIYEPQDLRQQALNAALASRLDFGAVDLIWNEKENKCYVLEVNSAPGIEGTTLQKYVEAFVKDIKNV